MMHQRIIGVVAFWIVGCSMSRAEHVRVFFLAGQSNINGVTQGSEIPAQWDYVQDDVWIWLDDRQGGGEWTDLRPGHGFLVHSPRTQGPTVLDPLDQIGPELSLGRALADRYPSDRIALIKHADGSNVHTHWNPLAVGQNDMWTSLLQKSTNAFDALTEAGHTFQVDAVFWAQGHGDTRNFSWMSNDPAVFEAGRQAGMETASHYQANFTRLIGAFRDEFGQDLPFVVSHPTFSSPSLAAAYPGIGIVREHTAAVAAQVPNVHLFEVDDLVTTDGIHFSAPAQIQHGQRFAATYLAAVPEPNSLFLTLCVALHLIGIRSSRRRLPHV